MQTGDEAVSRLDITTEWGHFAAGTPVRVVSKGHADGLGDDEGATDDPTAADTDADGDPNEYCVVVAQGGGRPFAVMRGDLRQPEAGQQRG